ncbi:MAG: hypothetical protein IPP13_28210 [Kouleothrix sp.]|nr:hypothetical protein [Kouleothrix sp.]
MPIRNEPRNRSETFGRLLSGAINSIATYEGKTAPVIEEELGALAIVSGKTIQRYKAGYLPPEQRTVEILAAAAVTRGFLGRAWLQRFLHVARYPGAEQLLDRLCPAPIVRARAPRVYQNLPSPTYSQFVMRAQAFAEVCEGLAARSAAVLVMGLGGQGKTSLAREVADACLKGVAGAPVFDAAVWVSDKDRPGTTNLSTVLDEIAHTLDYPGFTQFEHDEKRREVEQLLRKQKVLLVVDNFETVTDGALLSWLLRLPEPSKTLITSREYSRAFRNSTMVAELRGMTEAEAQALIVQRLRMLQLDNKVKEPTEFEPLVTVTGGNPKAIEIALGLVKHERRPLQQVVDDLYAARGELFDDLFTRAWSLLDEAARRVLMVMTFFPDSASGEAVAASADVLGYAFDRAVERLTDLALLDVQQADLSNAPRYTLHPLVRVFAGVRLAEQPSFEESARERWSQYFLQFVTKHIVQNDNIEQYWRSLASIYALKSIKPDWINIKGVLKWASENNHSELLVNLMMMLVHYMDRVGLFSDRIDYCRKAIQAAMLIDRISDAAWLHLDGILWALIETDMISDIEKEIEFGRKVIHLLSSQGIDVDDFRVIMDAHLARMHVLNNELKLASPIISEALSVKCSLIVKSRIFLTAGEFYQKNDEIDQAINYYIKAIEIIKQYQRNEEYYDARYRLGFAYLSKGDVEKAEIEFRSLTSSEKNLVTIESLYGLYGLALITKYKGDIDTARCYALEAFDKVSGLQRHYRIRKDIEAFLKLLDGDVL